MLSTLLSIKTKSSNMKDLFIKARYLALTCTKILYCQYTILNLPDPLFLIRINQYKHSVAYFKTIGTIRQIHDSKLRKSVTTEVIRI